MSKTIKNRITLGAIAVAIASGTLLSAGCAATPIPERPTPECFQIWGHGPVTGVDGLTIADIDAGMARAHAAGGCEGFIAEYRPMFTDAVNAQSNASMTSCTASGMAIAECRKLIDSGVQGG